MITYLMNIALLIIFGIVFLWYKPSYNKKKTFCIVASFQWIVLSGFRHYSIGTDTYAYKISFEANSNRSWASLWNNFVNIIFKGFEGADPGYYLFEKFVYMFTTNYQMYLIVIALIFTISLGIWIFKNSAEPLMSFLIYSCLFSSFFATTGLRQTLATALVVLIGYKFIKEKKIWPFLLIMIVAFTIHKSAVCFLPFYFIADNKINRRYLTLMSVITISLFVVRNQFIAILGSFMGYEKYTRQYEGAGTQNFTVLLIIIAISTIWKYKIILKNNPDASNYINALVMAFVFLPLTYIDPSTMRVVQYYSIFLMLLVPEILKSFNNRDRIIVYYVAAILLMALYFKNSPQYLFFWQG